MSGARRVVAGATDAGAGEHGTPPVATVVSVNGRIVDPSAPALSPFDRGFLLGDGLFETVRVYDGEPFRLDRHLARMRDGATLLGIALPPQIGAMTLGTVAEARAHQLREAVLRVTVSRGAGGGGLVPQLAPGVAEPRPTVVISISALPAFTHQDGVSAHIASGRRNEHASTAGVKALGYAELVVAAAEARAAGADDALLLDVAGHVSTGASSNVFALLGDTLVTPPPGCGILLGITRAAVLELAAAAGVATAERPLERAELLAAREAFLTSSVREIAPLVRVDGSVGTGRPGEVTRRLQRAYDALVRRECAGQRARAAPAPGTP